MALNNIGTYPFQENYGRLRIQEYSWSANSDQFGCDLGLLAVTVNESLNLTIGGPLLGSPPCKGTSRFSRTFCKQPPPFG